MIYPSDFEDKIGFTPLRVLLKDYCRSPQGKLLASGMSFCTSYAEVKKRLTQTCEMLQAVTSGADFPT